MDIGEKAGCIVGVIGLLVVMPIWYFLLYQILAAVNATDVMWLLYWVYLPVALIAAVIKEVAKQ